MNSPNDRTDDAWLGVRLLWSAQALNAPGSGFATHGMRRLAAIRRQGALPAAVDGTEALATIAELAAHLGGCITLAHSVVNWDGMRGESHAEAVALLNTALGATAAAYGAVVAALEELTAEREGPS